MTTPTPEHWPEILPEEADLLELIDWVLRAKTGESPGTLMLGGVKSDTAVFTLCVRADATSVDSVRTLLKQVEQQLMPVIGIEQQKPH